MKAPGAIELGKRVKELLMGEGGMKRVDEDKNRGLDHGAWVPLMLMYPEADIPVCQLSVQSSQSGTYHYNMGKALAPLKDEGVLIIGSGSATHNLRKLDFYITNGSAVPWALAFDYWLRDSLLQGRYELQLQIFIYIYISWLALQESLIVRIMCVIEQTSAMFTGQLGNRRA
ncbi:unnamed protein product [Brassica oleracea]